MKQDGDTADVLEGAPAAVLRLIDGPQRDAQMPLRADRYVIGRGDSADICLVDDAAADEHAAVMLGEDGITVEALGGRVALSDRWLEVGETATLPLPCTLLIGSTGVAIGLPATDWAALSVPDPAVFPPPLDEDSSDGDETTAPASKAGADASGPEAAKETNGSRRRGLLLGAALVALVAGVGGGLYAVGSGSSKTEATVATQAATERAEALQALKTAVDAAGVDGATVRHGPDGGLRVAGYVADDAALDRLRASVAASGVEAPVQTHSIAQLTATLEALLDTHTWPEAGFRDHLTVAHIQDGAFRIDGFLGPNVEAGALQRLISSDVPGVTEIRFTRATLRYWQQVLERQLKYAGLDQWLNVAPHNDTLRVSGDLTGAEVPIWRRTGEAFVEQNGGWPRLSIEVRQVTPGPKPEPVAPATAAAPPAPTRPAIAVLGVIVSDTGDDRALLADGESLRVGDTAENGAELIEVSSEFVRFRQDGHVYLYRVRRPSAEATP